MSDNVVSKSVMLVGNFSASNTESNLTVKCPQTKPSEEEMMLSTPSSVKLELENTSQELSSLT